MPDYFIDGKGKIKTILSQKISLSGELSFEDSLEIHGEFSGVIRSKGLLVVGSSAVVRGDIYSKDLIVEGKIFGNILICNRLSIESHAEIVGDITTHKIKVMNNAVLDGNCFTLDTEDLSARFHKAAPDTYFRKDYDPKSSIRIVGKPKDTPVLRQETTQTDELPSKKYGKPKKFKKN